jgi:hypothetical protein
MKIIVIYQLNLWILATINWKDIHFSYKMLENMR